MEKEYDLVPEYVIPPEEKPNMDLEYSYLASTIKKRKKASLAARIASVMALLTLILSAAKTAGAGNPEEEVALEQLEEQLEESGF